MPKFTVLCRVDAFVDYLAEVEAENPEAAAWIAKEGPPLEWRRLADTEFDARLFVTLDQSGNPIEATQCGDF